MAAAKDTSVWHEISVAKDIPISVVADKSRADRATGQAVAPVYRKVELALASIGKVGPSWSLGIAKKGLCVSSTGLARAWRIANITDPSENAPPTISLVSEHLGELGLLCDKVSKDISKDLKEACKVGNAAAAKFMSGL